MPYAAATSVKHTGSGGSRRACSQRPLVEKRVGDVKRDCWATAGTFWTTAPEFAGRRTLCRVRTGRAGGAGIAHKLVFFGTLAKEPATCAEKV
jgi:hypothetical protein